MNKSLTNNSSTVGNTTFSCIAQKAKELVNGTNSIKFDSANNSVYFKYISQSPTNALSIEVVYAKVWGRMKLAFARFILPPTLAHTTFFWRFTSRRLIIRLILK